MRVSSLIRGIWGPLGVVLLGIALLTPVDTAVGQAPSGEGEASRTRWPDVVYEAQGAMDLPFVRAAEQYGEASLLPRVDSLVLHYAWSTVESLPHIEFDLWWTRGDGGIMDGEIVPTDRMPAEIVLDLIDLHAEVHVDGRYAGDLVLTLDSLWLPPSPDLYAFETVDVPWSDVFASMDSTTARKAFSSGFTLENLDILRVAFEPVPEADPPGRDVPVVLRQPRSRTIFVPDTDIWIGWNLGPDPYRAPPRRTRRTYAPRGDAAGRTVGTTSRRTPNRSTRREQDGESEAKRRTGDRNGIPIPKAGKSKSDDDDDDDDRDLLGPAAVGLAAVGVLAYAGGTFGLQAHGDAPIGLFAGAVRPRWAFLIHAAVNSDVITADDDERMRGGMVWALRPVAGGLRPLFGAGALLRERGDTIVADPTVDLGILFTANELVILASLDVLTGTPRFGIGVDLRAGR